MLRCLTLRFVAEKGFIQGEAKRGHRRISLKSDSCKARSLRYLWVVTGAGESDWVQEKVR